MRKLGLAKLEVDESAQLLMNKLSKVLEQFSSSRFQDFLNNP
jgi:biotin-(acetyl-CoA carboxylase) ligase